MDLRLAVTEAGWAKANLSHDGQELELPVSAYTDGIADFLSAVIDLLEGAALASWCWIAEPDANWIRIHRDRDWLRLAVINVPTMLAEIDDPAAEVTLRGSLPLADLAALALREVDRNFARLGDLGYRRCWHHPFPTDLIQRIAELQGA